uniref:Uncharacterized protein n=1 Tax=Tanacetum cinerariifolium TaxID=118510 RepID=A0A6L2MZB0_TANCI|nr:hypothetical protein [Tanacetum cinerariifolium]
MAATKKTMKDSTGIWKPMTVLFMVSGFKVVEPRNKPAQIEIIENVHKRQKENDEWRDSKEEKVAFDMCENIKEKVVQVYETADDSGQPFDDPIDPCTWAEVICIPENKEVNGAGCSQVAVNTLNQSNSTSSTKEPNCNTSGPPDDTETETGLEIKARIEAEVKSRVKAVRLKMKEQIENQFKQIFGSLQNTMPCNKSIGLAEERKFTLLEERMDSRNY